MKLPYGITIPGMLSLINSFWKLSTHQSKIQEIRLGFVKIRVNGSIKLPTT